MPVLNLFWISGHLIFYKTFCNTAVKYNSFYISFFNFIIYYNAYIAQNSLHTYKSLKIIKVMNIINKNSESVEHYWILIYAIMVSVILDHYCYYI